MPPLNNQPGPQGYNNQPNPQSPQPAGSPYDFFLEQQRKPKRSLLPKNSSNFAKLLVAAGIFFVVLIVAAIILNINRNSHKSTAPGLDSVVKEQSEIIHLTTQAGSVLQSANLQNFAITAASTTTSSQQAVMTYLTKSGIKVNTKPLLAYIDTGIDGQLTAAQAASTYDTSFQTIMQQQLTSYQVTLQQIHDAALSQSERNLLDTDLTSVHLLQTMLAE